MSKAEKKKRKKKRKPVAEKLNPEQVKYINDLDDKHTKSVLENRVTYPDPEDFDSIDSEKLAELGFEGKTV